MPTSVKPNTFAAQALRFNHLHEWLAWQESLHYTAIELGLDRCRKVAERLMLLKPDFTVISIAGTNGKGSSAAMLEMMLSKSGYRVGCYTSPHLIRYNERIRINRAEVEDQAICHSFQRIDHARQDISLTYFEFSTLAALDIFNRSGIDIAIMEVGLGGRLDAVNILDADVSLVSTIDLDHEEWLGPDRYSIGREKAGIFRSMRPAICSDLNPPASINESAQITGAALYLAGKDFTFSCSDDSWTWKSSAKMLTSLPRPGQKNNNQIQNAAGVLMVLEKINERFPVSDETIRTSLSEFRLNGRFQIIPAEIPVVLDVAHNKQAAEALAENLEKLPITGKTYFIVGMLKDKNHLAVFNGLSALADNWYLVSLDNKRAADVDKLVASLSTIYQQEKINICKNVREALKAVREIASPGDRIVITGSFLTVGSAIKELQLEIN